MNLSTGQMTLIFAGCIVVISGILVMWRRGLFTPKEVVSTSVTHSQPAPTSEVVK